MASNLQSFASAAEYWAAPQRFSRDRFRASTSKRLCMMGVGRIPGRVVSKNANCLVRPLPSSIWANARVSRPLRGRLLRSSHRPRNDAIWLFLVALPHRKKCMRTGLLGPEGASKATIATSIGSSQLCERPRRGTTPGRAPVNLVSCVVPRFDSSGRRHVPLHRAYANVHFWAKGIVRALGYRSLPESLISARTIAV